MMQGGYPRKAAGETSLIRKRDNRLIPRSIPVPGVVSGVPAGKSGLPGANPHA